MKRFLIKVLFFFTCFDLYAFNEGLHTSSYELVSAIQANRQVTYIDTNKWLDEVDSFSILDQIKKSVLSNEEYYIFDFGSILNSIDRNKAKEKLRDRLGVSFEFDILMISQYKGDLLFTPIENTGQLELNKLIDSLNHKAKRDTPLKSANETTIPQLSFYLAVNRPITEKECTFRISNLWLKGERVFCDEPNISLIYRVVLERSLPYGSAGSTTPDAKIVRITIDDESTGSGIHLNDNLSYFKTTNDSIVLDGWFKNWSTDAIAQDYKFEFNSSNDKAQILVAAPRSNINSNYSITERESFTLGIQTSGEVDSVGPKGKVEANGSYTQSNSLTFDTQDYQVIRSTHSPQDVSFTWLREQFQSSESLLKWSTESILHDQYPVDISRIKPISFANFVPKMDVIFVASSNETGQTNFTIDTSVNIKPLYHGAYKHYYVLGSHQSFHGFENDIENRVNKKVGFTVNWDNPVFTGGRLVKLQLGSFNSRCIEVNSGNDLVSSDCDENKTSQSFIYDKLGRYTSINNLGYCIDGNNAIELATCNMNLSQRWKWEDDSDKLINEYNSLYLGYSKGDGNLGLFTSENDDISLSFLTYYSENFGDIDIFPDELNGASIGKNGKMITFKLPIGLFDDKNRIEILNGDESLILVYDRAQYYMPFLQMSDDGESMIVSLDSFLFNKEFIKIALYVVEEDAENDPIIMAKRRQSL